MRKSFKYRIYPSAAQKTILNKTLVECQILYNHLLSERTISWEQHKKSLSLYQQQKTFTLLKSQRPSLDIVYSQVLQNVSVRVDLAFKSFFRRCRSGEKPGYPRRKINTYDSITYTQLNNGSFKLFQKKIHLSKIGDIGIKQHRNLEGIPKTCTVSRTATGKWYVGISCEVESKPLPQNKSVVGIDLGLKSFAVLSDSTRISNPRFFKEEENNLAKAQRSFSKQRKRTRGYKKKKRVVARIHERIKNKRHNFCHQESSKIIKKYGTICVEDLNTKKMLEEKKFSKSISDAAWSLFLSCLSYKAESADRTFVKINPAYTTQTCSCCGHRQQMPLNERIFRCEKCGLVIGRDLNAAINIKRAGLCSLANTA